MMLMHKLGNIISGYKINEDDAAWLRALIAENDRLKLALSGRTQGFDAESFKAGMLAAVEIASEYTSVYDIANDFLGTVTESIKAKAEEVK